MFMITQHLELPLMSRIVDFFGCGKVYTRGIRHDYIVQSLDLLDKIIVPHFTQYPLHNIKQLDYIDFQTIIKGRLNKTMSIFKAQEIINGMNSKR